MNQTYCLIFEIGFNSGHEVMAGLKHLVRFLESFDEISDFYNLLKGEMNLSGAR